MKSTKISLLVSKGTQARNAKHPPSAGKSDRKSFLFSLVSPHSLAHLTLQFPAAVQTVALALTQCGVGGNSEMNSSSIMK